MYTICISEVLKHCFCYSVLAKTTIVAYLFYFYFVYYLFRFYFIMASFPCGKCFLECEGEKTIACDNCDKWFHQKCESLSNIHFFFFMRKLNIAQHEPQEKSYVISRTPEALAVPAPRVPAIVLLYIIIW